MKNIILAFTILLILASCRNKENFPEKSELFGLGSTVLLNPGENKIFLTDYFVNTGIIDSVSINGTTRLSSSDKFATLLFSTDNMGLKPLNELQVWIKGTKYSILLRKSAKVKYNFTFDPGGKEFKTVGIAGDINGWNPEKTPLSLNNGAWTGELILDPGRYQYKIVCDGTWGLDPNNPDSVDNNMGAYNSLLVIKGPEKDSLPFLYTAKTGSGKITIGSTNKTEEIIVFWQNYRLNDGYIKIKGNACEISIPQTANKEELSYVRAWAFNKHGVSNDILVPLQKGKVVLEPKDLGRQDYHAMIMYFLMIDRFFNGNTANDKPMNTPEVLPKVDYFGGDLAGVLAKMKEGFFDSLGVNTVWLSPLTQNPDKPYGQWKTPMTKFSPYHGYWPVSLSDVDHRFGTDDDLKAIVDEAHNADMNILLDYVAHHVHQDHPSVKAHPDWFTSLYLPDGTMNTEKWDEHRLTTWFDTFLPTFDFSKPEVVNIMSDSAVYWVEKFGIDGFRHDATKHVPEEFWRELTRKLKEKVMIPSGKPLYQIGETYGNRELISRYITSGQMDCQFDFGMYDAALPVFGKDDISFEVLENSMRESFYYYGYHNLMGYITGNQDKPRFISLAGGSLKWDENAKQAGWDREIGVGDPAAYDKLALFMAFNMTIPGVPVIYYGDEYGMPGANDPDNRRMMKFGDYEKEEKELRDITVKLANLRKNSMALLYGDTYLLYRDDNTFVYARKYFDRIAVIAMNKGNAPQNVEFNLPAWIGDGKLHPAFGKDFTQAKGLIRISLPPRSFEILANK